MTPSLRLFPEQASALAAGVDALALATIALEVLFLVLFLFGATLWRHRAPRGFPSSLMAGWSLFAAAGVIALAAWSERISKTAARAEPAFEIELVAKQWAWKIRHGQGRREINELHLPLGYPVRLRLTSEDAPHLLALPAFRLKQVAEPARWTSLEFVPTRPGEFELLCAGRCGPYCSKMRGVVLVMETRDYLAWVRGEVPGESPLELGKRLYGSLQCDSCHRPDGAGRGPSLGGLFGSTVMLREGGTVLAGDEYLRESILNPGAKVVAGYEPLMPSFQGRLSESQLQALLAFLKTLEGGPR